MAVAVEMEIPGGTLEQYDQLIEKLGLPDHGPGAEGSLFHWVAKTDDGILICDVWERQEDFERYARTQIGPAVADLGDEMTQNIRFYEVHQMNTANLPQHT